MVYRINRDPIIDDNRVLRVDRMRVGSFSQSYQFQGSTSGYTSGGNPINPAGNIIDKYPFASNANATDVGDLTQKREVATGQSSGASGYTSGGISPAYTNVIDKFPFSAIDKTEILPGKLLATKFVPSTGSTAISKFNPFSVPKISPV